KAVGDAPRVLITTGREHQQHRQGCNAKLRPDYPLQVLTDSTIRVGFMFSDNIIRRICTQFPLAAVALAVAFRLGGYVQALAHENHEHFSAGQPGDPQTPSRTVKVSMLEEGKRMLFDPPSIEARLGEQIRFVLFNEGSEYHEFVLATHAENRKHAELMKKLPNMERNDPNAKRLS